MDGRWLKSDGPSTSKLSSNSSVSDVEPADGATAFGAGEVHPGLILGELQEPALALSSCKAWSRVETHGWWNRGSNFGERSGRMPAELLDKNSKQQHFDMISFSRPQLERLP